MRWRVGRHRSRGGLVHRVEGTPFSSFVVCRHRCRNNHNTKNTIVNLVRSLMSTGAMSGASGVGAARSCAQVRRRRRRRVFDIAIASGSPRALGVCVCVCIDRLLSLGSTDNISVIVVHLNGYTPKVIHSCCFCFVTTDSSLFVQKERSRSQLNDDVSGVYHALFDVFDENILSASSLSLCCRPVLQMIKWRSLSSRLAIRTHVLIVDNHRIRFDH
jgi:hypothetical protein